VNPALSRNCEALRGRARTPSSRWAVVLSEEGLRRIHEGSSIERRAVMSPRNLVLVAVIALAAAAAVAVTIVATRRPNRPVVPEGSWRPVDTTDR
jgi:hypothetical protein